MAELPGASGPGRPGKRAGVVVSLVGIGIQFLDVCLSEGEARGPSLAFWLGLLVLGVGLGLYSKAKGHSAAFCVAAIASLLGLLLVGLLEDRNARPSDEEEADGRRTMQQAAKASWVAALLAFLIQLTLSGLHSGSQRALYIRLAAEGLLVVVGFLAGLVALLSMRKHGRTGILWPALIGTGINGLILLLSVGLLFMPAGGIRKRVEPVTETRLAVPDTEACVQFARKLEDTIKDGDASFAITHCDVDLLVNRLLAGSSVSQKAMDTAREGVESALRSNFDRLAQKGGQRIQYTCVRVHDVGNERRALFRVWMNPGLNYHDLVLVSRGDQVMIADIYVFATGEFLSNSFRRSALPLLMSADRSVAARLLSAEDDYVKAWPQVEQLAGLAVDGNAGSALAVYESLPASVKKDKSVMLLRLKVASALGVDSPQYQEALSEMKELFPNDPCLHLLLLDHYSFTHDYRGLQDCLQALQEETGDDEFLRELGLRLVNGQ